MCDIIVLIGNERAGKTTFANFLPDDTTNKLAFADKLRDSLAAVIGDVEAFKRDYTRAYRDIMRDLSIVFRHHLSQADRSPFTIDVASRLSRDKLNVITDMRYLNEYEWLLSSGNTARFVHIKKTSTDALRGYEFDKIRARQVAPFTELINNGSLLDYQAKVLEYTQSFTTRAGI